MSQRVVFHVDMNAFFASVEQQYNPTLRGKPIVVCGNAKKRTVVAACSYEAKAYGIQNGMSVFEAQALCPQVLLVGGNPEKYVDISRGIFAVLAEFSPEMEIFSIDEAFLEMNGTYRFFGAQPEDAARRMKERIRAGWGLTCSIGIGPNRLIAKLASGLKKPDGLVRVRPEEVPALLEHLPVEELCGVGPNLKVYLNELGIMTCGQMGRAPEHVLVERFGVLGRALKRMGQGVDETPVGAFDAASPAKSMGHAYTLPRDTADEEEIRGTLLRLSEQVARRLRLDGCQGRLVHLTVRYADFSGVSRQRALAHGVSRQRALAHPTDAGWVIYRTALALLEEHSMPLPRRVRLLGVRAGNLLHGQRQMSFLEEERRLALLDRCVDRVSDRFGEFTVVRAGALAPLTPKSHGFISYQVVQEFLNVALRRFEEPLSTRQPELYLDQALLPLCEIFPSQDLYRSALRLKEESGIHFYGALVVASALEGKCAVLYSEDLQHGRRFSELVVRDPFRVS